MSLACVFLVIDPIMSAKKCYYKREFSVFEFSIQSIRDVFLLSEPILDTCQIADTHVSNRIPLSNTQTNLHIVGSVN